MTFNGKAVTGAAKLSAWFAASVALSGCAQWQSQQIRLRSDYQRVRSEERQRADYTACVNQGALPGSAENLACQLDMAKKEQEAAKAKNRPDKAP